jgi:hypothetical protein
MTRRKFAVLLMAGATPTRAFLAPRKARATEAIPVTLYKNPSCTCCEGYAQYLDQNGFEVDVRPTNDLAAISRKAGIPEALEGCHTSFIGDYVVEKPAIAGITLPGMPTGTPGMDGEKTAPLTIYAVSRDGVPPRVFDVD